MLKSCPKVSFSGVLAATGFQHGNAEVLKEKFAVGSLEKVWLKVENVLKMIGILKIYS